MKKKKRAHTLLRITYVQYSLIPIKELLSFYIIKLIDSTNNRRISYAV